MPDIDLLDRHDMTLSHGMDTAQQAEMAALLEKKLQEFGVQARVVAVHPGPVVTCTRFNLQQVQKAVKYQG